MSDYRPNTDSDPTRSTPFGTTTLPEDEFSSLTLTNNPLSSLSNTDQISQPLQTPDPNQISNTNETVLRQTVLDFFVNKNSNNPWETSVLITEADIKDIIRNVSPKKLQNSKLTFSTIKEESEYWQCRKIYSVSNNDYLNFKSQFSSQDMASLNTRITSLKSCSDFKSTIGPFVNVESFIEFTFLTNPSHKDKMWYQYTRLNKHIHRWRKIKGDGNCYYRAIIFRYWELLILNNRKDQWKSLIMDINQCYRDPMISSRLMVWTNLMIKPDLVVKILILIHANLVDNNPGKAYEIYMKSILYCSIFDYGLIWYLRYIFYKYIKNNERKLYTKEFAIWIGNLWPSEYETETGEFLFNDFYSNYLWKMFKDAEKIIVYLTPFVLNMKVDVIWFEDCTKDFLKEFMFYGESKQRLEDLKITVINAKNHYELIYTESEFKEKESLYRIFQFEYTPRVIKGTHFGDDKNEKEKNREGESVDLLGWNDNQGNKAKDGGGDDGGTNSNSNKAIGGGGSEGSNKVIDQNNVNVNMNNNNNNNNNFVGKEPKRAVAGAAGNNPNAQVPVVNTNNTKDNNPPCYNNNNNNNNNVHHQDKPQGQHKNVNAKAEQVTKNNNQNQNQNLNNKINNFPVQDPGNTNINTFWAKSNPVTFKDKAWGEVKNKNELFAIDGSAQDNPKNKENLNLMKVNNNSKKNENWRYFEEMPPQKPNNVLDINSNNNVPPKEPTENIKTTSISKQNKGKGKEMNEQTKAEQNYQRNKEILSNNNFIAFSDGSGVDGTIKNRNNNKHNDKNNDKHNDKNNKIIAVDTNQWYQNPFDIKENTQSQSQSQSNEIKKCNVNNIQHQNIPTQHPIEKKGLNCNQINNNSYPNHNQNPPQNQNVSNINNFQQQSSFPSTNMNQNAYLPNPFQEPTPYQNNSHNKTYIPNPFQEPTPYPNNINNNAYLPNPFQEPTPYPNKVNNNVYIPNPFQQQQTPFPNANNINNAYLPNPFQQQLPYQSTNNANYSNTNTNTHQNNSHYTTQGNNFYQPKTINLNTNQTYQHQNTSPSSTRNCSICSKSFSLSWTYKDITFCLNCLSKEIRSSFLAFFLEYHNLARGIIIQQHQESTLINQLKNDISSRVTITISQKKYWINQAWDIMNSYSNIEHKYDISSYFKKMQHSICVACDDQLKDNNWILPCKCCFCNYTCLKNYFTNVIKLNHKKKKEIICTCGWNYPIPMIYELGVFFSNMNCSQEWNEVIKLFRDLIKDKCANIKCKGDDSSGKQKVRYKNVIDQSKYSNGEIKKSIPHELCKECYEGHKYGNFYCKFCKCEHVQIEKDAIIDDDCAIF